MGVRVTCIYIIDKCTHGLKCSECCDLDFDSGYSSCDLYVGKDERLCAPCYYYNPCKAMIHRTYKAVEYESDIGLTLGREIIPRENIIYLAMDYGDGEKIFIDEREGLI